VNSLPQFELPLDDGTILQREDVLGSPAVFFFYPRDNTPGCTREAIAFSQALSEFQKLGIRVIGISRDSLESHRKFRKKHDLTVDLGSDFDHALMSALGVWKEKSMYGKTYMGIERSTFLLDSEGVIVKDWRKVKVKGHVEAVLEAARAL